MPPRALVRMSLSACIRRFKRSAATATAHRIRILDAEARARQIVCVIHRATFEKTGARGIDDHLHPATLEKLIVGLRMIERHAVLHPCAPALLDENAQPFRRIVLFADERLQLLNCGIGEGEHGRNVG